MSESLEAPKAVGREFTLRKKNTPSPILTLSASVLNRFLTARPDSVALVLAKYLADYKALTGKSLVLDYLQKDALTLHFGCDNSGQWTSKYSALVSEGAQVRNCFQAGFLHRTVSPGLLADLATAERFFDTLDLSLA